MKIKCHRCKKEWEYKGIKEKLVGKYPQYISCSKCRTSVKLEKENHIVANARTLIKENNNTNSYLNLSERQDKV